MATRTCGCSCGCIKEFDDKLSDSEEDLISGYSDYYPPAYKIVCNNCKNGTHKSVT